jgi:hypothetical protein
MKTIKQIADELGVDKQKIYRYIVKNHITASSDVMQTKHYDDAAEILIKSAFSHITASSQKDSEPLQKNGSDTVFEALIHQLDVKDKQIEELNARLAESNTALVSAQQAVQAAQALHAGTIRQQIKSGVGADQESSEAPSPRKETFFSRFLRKTEQNKV